MVITKITAAHQNQQKTRCLVGKIIIIIKVRCQASQFKTN